MRGWYLRSSDEVMGGCRGGVGSKNDDYDLEIGQSCNADPDMIALCVLVDEVLTYLKKSDCPIAQLLYDKHRQVSASIDSMQRGIQGDHS